MIKSRLLVKLLLFFAIFMLFNPTKGRKLNMIEPDKVGMCKNRLEQIDRVIEESIANNETAGAVILVARKGRIVYRKAYGYRMLEPRREKMTIDTIFDLASVSKPVATASGIMLLAEDGKLRLGDRVSRFIPNFGEGGKERVTIAHLLVHTSGLPAWDRYFEKELDPAGIIADIAAKDTTYEPGTKFVYSDLGFIILGEIINRVSGKSIDEFLAQRLFQPLGMKDTGFILSADKKLRSAATEYRNGVMLQGEVHDGNAWMFGGLAGHAGLFSTVDDLAIYCQMILNGGYYGKTRIFSPLTVREMSTNQSTVEQFPRGFGWGIGASYEGQRGDIFPRGGFGHTGWTGTSIWIDPNSQTFVILLCNRNHPDGRGDVGRLRGLVNNIVAASIIK